MKRLKNTLQDTPKRREFDQVRWIDGIRVRSIFGFAVLFLLVAFAITYQVQRVARSEIQAESDRLTRQIGTNIVTELVAETKKIAAAARNLSATISSVLQSEDVYARVIPNLLDERSQADMSGGGVWLAPFKFSEMPKRSFYWDTNVAGMLERVDYYNRIDVDYFGKEWYTNAFVSDSQRCVWTRLHNVFAKPQPKMSCSVRIARDREFYGSATIDYDLSKLSKLTQAWQSQLGGYVFVTDRDNQLLSFPDVMKSKIASHEHISVKELAEVVNSFDPIHDAIQRFDEQALTFAKDSQGQTFRSTYNSLRSATTGLSDAQLRSAALSVSDGLRQYFQGRESGTLFGEMFLSEDQFLKEPAKVYLFHVPQSYWKLGIVIPVSKTRAVANHLTRKLLQYMLVAFFLLSLVTYFMLTRGIILPIERIADSLRSIADLINQKRFLELPNHALEIKQKSEIGLLRHNINMLMERIMQNESELAAANVLLEKKVEERTEALSDALRQLKRSQADLVNSEKMAILGQMVAGVAHEVNTPLGYVKGNFMMVMDMVGQCQSLTSKSLQLNHLLETEKKFAQDKAFVEIAQQMEELNEGYLAEEDVKQLFDDTLFGIDQISELIVNLKNFARLDEAKVKNVDIHECIESSLNIARGNLKYFEVKKRYKDTPELSCTPSQINQVFLNLFNNAAQAMTPHSGILTIATTHDANYVHVSVKDNGSGIEQSVLERVFEPFFTTKKAGEGTGLGLAICSQILEQHQGQIRVKSKPGKGTQFIVSLPFERN